MNKEIQAQLEKLSEVERKRLIDLITQFVFESEINLSDMESEKKKQEGSLCPHCQSSKTRKNGFQYGVQRLVCNSCKKNFRFSTGMATVYLKKKELLKTYIPHFIAGYSLQKCADLTGICKQTSFNWRHKILAALGKFQEEKKMSGIFEADEVFFEHSLKGDKNIERAPRKRGKGVFETKKRGVSNDKIAVIISCDRKGNKILKVAAKGRITTEDVSIVLKGKVEAKSILCTDGHRSYEGFAKANDLEHQTIKVTAKEYVKNGKYHVQHVNQTAKELKQWLDKFGGVSTKYLQNYLNWYAVKKHIENSPNIIFATTSLLAASYNANDLFKTISENYNILIRP